MWPSITPVLMAMLTGPYISSGQTNSKHVWSSVRQGPHMTWQQWGWGTRLSSVYLYVHLIMNPCRHFWKLLKHSCWFVFVFTVSVFTPSGEIPISTSVPNRPYWFFWAWTWAIPWAISWHLYHLYIGSINTLVLLVPLRLDLDNLFVGTFKVWHFESVKVWPWKLQRLEFGTFETTQNNWVSEKVT